MTTRTTNIILLKQLVSGLGKRGQAKLELEADISRSSIRDMLRGAIPGAEVRGKVSSYFKISENKLWPFLEEKEAAA